MKNQQISNSAAATGPIEEDLAPESTSNRMGWSLLIGFAVGLMIGVLTGNIAAGIGFGIGFGLLGGIMSDGSMPEGRPGEPMMGR